MQKKLSLVIAGTIFISFMLLLVISSASIRYFGMKGAEEKAAIIADLVQDGLTAHMMSGTMDQREFFLKKIGSARSVDSLWVVRSESVANQFGKGLHNEASRDAIDQQVLKSGIVYKKSEETSSSAKLRVTTPYIAKEHNMPNCLSCHDAKEGEVLGAVSMVFDIGDSRTNGLMTSLIIFLFSIIIMVLVVFIINRSMKPLLELFHSINFVMEKAQKGDYKRRVRFSGKNEDCKNAMFWINSLLDKLESTLLDIEHTVNKFLSLNTSVHKDLLMETKDIVSELSDIYQFKRTIEFDEDKTQVYQRIGMILKETIKIDDFLLVESGKNNITPTIVFDASSIKKSINPTCRALRTKQSVYSDQFKNICESCSELHAHYICVPYLISNDFELLLSIWASSAEELEEIKAKLPQIENYIDAARPELVSKNLTEILKISSTTDALTGLFNRKYLDEYIEKTIAQAKRSGVTYGILMIDIDFFKMVNDTHGHDVGDKAIRILSKILKESIRESDTAFRFGGEEFLILLHQCEESMIENIAQKIRLTFEKAPIPGSNGASFYKTLSIGTSMFPKNSDSLWKCIKFADIALYNAKENGRNCVKTFVQEMIEGKEMKSEF